MKGPLPNSINLASMTTEPVANNTIATMKVP